MSNFQVVTCADQPPNESYYLWDEFNASLERYDIEPLVLGWGKPWKGLGSKPKLLKRAIEDGTISSQIIIVCDAFDVVFADHPRKIVEHLSDDILFNAEKACFPNASLAADHPQAFTPFRYLNSGLMVGYTEAILAALVDMRVDEVREDYQREDGSWWHANDQDDWMRQYLAHQRTMALDSACEVFQTMCGVTADEIDLTGPKIRNTVTGTTPIVYHFNGPGKTQGLREPILAKLGL